MLFSDDVKSSDQSLFYILSAFLSILKTCKISRSTKLIEVLASTFSVIETLLLHPHDWVQLLSCQIFGCVFAEWDPNEISPLNRVQSCWFDPEDLDEKLLNLSKNFCEQMKAKTVMEKLAEQLVKNLLFLARVFDNKYFRQITPVDDKESLPIHKGILLILRKARTLFVQEQTYAPRETTKRVAILKFCAAFYLNIKDPERVLHMILDPLSRGVNASVLFGSYQPPKIMKLRQLSREVLEIVKSKVNPETFPQVYMKVTQLIARKQKARKEFRAQQFVKNPVKATKRKLQHHHKKKVVKKQKIIQKRPHAMKRPIKV